MKNSFFLVIPEQQKDENLLAAYKKEAINQWLLELPTANPGLSTRLFYDFIEQLNTVEMPVQQRLDALEVLRPEFLSIEEYLRPRLISSGFPKGEDEQKVFSLIISIEKHFTTGYWNVVRELTGRDVGWFKGKDAVLAIQRTIKGLSRIVVTHYMMFLPVPEWVWIDIHSLYRLSVRSKNETTKVNDETCLPGKTSTIEDSYKQILLLSLADPTGLMQKEFQQVYNFIGQIAQHVRIESQPIKKQSIQCIVLPDEDAKPYFDQTGKQADTEKMYLNILKLNKMLKKKDKFSNKNEARFGTIQLSRRLSDKLSIGLLEYLIQCWEGTELKGSLLFTDRLDRHVVIGITEAHLLQHPEDNANEGVEILAESFSDKALSCKFEKIGVLSIGRLVSYRKANESKNQYSLGIVKKMTMPKQGGCIIFELEDLSDNSYVVTYLNRDAKKDSEPFKALLYGVKTEIEEKSFIILESLVQKDDDIIRINMNDESFPIVLVNKKNVGLGYFQFECRRMDEEKVIERSEKKGFDFI
ncbi:MAG: hypothetical protein KAT04_00850 [Methylococcales bacterium]|nr:hypothetical protein [Methylococcales bacterium]